MMGTVVKGYTLTKDGKLIKRQVFADVSARIRAKKSKKVKVVKRAG